LDYSLSANLFEKGIMKFAANLLGQLFLAFLELHESKLLQLSGYSRNLEIVEIG
jgi:hypothetical protein